MQITNFTPANLPVFDQALNPNFFAATSDGQMVEHVVFQPPAILVPVHVQPPPITQDVGGQLVTQTFPAIDEMVTVVPPPIIRDIVKPGAVVDPYESMGVVQGEPPRLCALITSRLVAAAHHYPISGEVWFYNQQGIVKASIKGSVAVYGDLEIYEIDQVQSIKPAKLTSALMLSQYAGLPTVSFGLIGSRLGPYDGKPAATRMKILRAISGTSGVVTCTGVSVDGSYLEPGDSGAPHYFMFNDQPYYLGSARKLGSTFEVNMIHPWANKIISL
jgi:hypothetical protein